MENDAVEMDQLIDRMSIQDGTLPLKRGIGSVSPSADDLQVKATKDVVIVSGPGQCSTFEMKPDWKGGKRLTVREVRGADIEPVEGNATIFEVVVTREVDSDLFVIAAFQYSEQAFTLVNKVALAVKQSHGIELDDSGNVLASADPLREQWHSGRALTTKEQVVRMILFLAVGIAGIVAVCFSVPLAYKGGQHLSQQWFGLNDDSGSAILPMANLQREMGPLLPLNVPAMSSEEARSSDSRIGDAEPAQTADFTNGGVGIGEGCSPNGLASMSGNGRVSCVNGRWAPSGLTPKSKGSDARVR